ncbi:MAG TPA: ATP synthase subunit I [Kofleriaceae bacterium]
MASPSIRRIERLNYAIGAIAIAAAALTQPRDIALGFTVGALLTCANFFVLRKLVTKWTRDAAQGRGGNASLLMLPKMIGLMGAVAIAIVFLPINIIAFTVGYSIFLVSIAIEATYSTLRIPDDEPGTAPTQPTNSDEHNHG